MASSLAQQLYHMKKVDRMVGSHAVQKTRPSFLFEPRQAADMDMQTIFDIGRDGINDLIKVNKAFGSYSSTLFSEAVKDMDRVLQTKSENEKLDESIRSFLFLLAPHFLTRPAGKALEWLIRRFRIQEFNAKDILAALMPYHETKAFLTMLTIISFSTEDMSVFGFMVSQRKARRLLDRATLIGQCLIDRSILAFICDAVSRARSLGLAYPGMYSFYAAVTSQYLERLSDIDLSTINFIMPIIVDGLDFEDKNSQVAAYMVLGTISARVTMTEQAVERVMVAVATRPADVRAMTLCLVQYVQTQAQSGDAGFSNSLLHCLANLSAFSQVYSDLAATFDLALFTRPLFTALMRDIFGGDSELTAFMEQLISVAPQSAGAVLCSSLVDEYIKHAGAEGAAGDIIDLIQLKHGQRLEDAIGAFARKSSPQDHEVLYKLKTRMESKNTSDVLSLKDTATTLYLSINHTDAGIRLIAAKSLCEIYNGKRKNVNISQEDASQLILDRLKYEDDSKVLAVILSLPVSQLIQPQALVPALTEIITGKRVESRSFIKSALGNLLAVNLEGDSQLYSAVVGTVLQLLRNTGHLSYVSRALIRALPNSEFVKQSGWLLCLNDLVHVGAEENVIVQIVKLLAAQLAAVPEYEELWAAQIANGSPLALAIGARAADILSDEDTPDRALSIAHATIDAAQKILASNSHSLHTHGAVEDMLVESTEGERWAAVLVNKSLSAMAIGVLSAALQILPRLGSLEPHRWFDSNAAYETTYRSAVRAAYTGMVTRKGSLEPFDGVLIGRMLASCMGGDWAQFLASFWTDASKPVMSRARSLLVFSALVRQKQEKRIDYQTLLPALLVALGDSERAVRSAAVGAIGALEHLYPLNDKTGEQNIYLYDAVYGPEQSTRLQYLPLPVVARFVALLATRATAMQEDSWAVGSELSVLLSKGVCSGVQSSELKLNSQARSAVGTYLVSHVTAVDSLAPALEARLLKVLEKTSPAGALELLFPLITAHLQRLQQSGSIPSANSTDDDVLRALFGACYKRETAEELRGPDGSAYWLALLAYAAGGDQPLIAYVQQLAFERLATPGFVEALGPEATADITSCLLRVADSGNAYSAAKDVSNVSLRTLFTSLNLDATAAAEELSTISARLSGEDKTKQPSSKRVRKSESAQAAVSLVDLASLLELVGCCKALSSSAIMAPSLFTLLQVLISEDNVVAAGTHEPIEYVKQLILGMLTSIFETANSSNVVIGESVVRVDVIVQVIRTSPSPQTHNQTLVLLAAVAEQHPQAVLHNIMAIFTFMGANVLRQDDDYSFHVIRQTLETVLPQLIRIPAENSRASQVEHAGPVLRVFVDALSHIPRHRRMALFTTLVATMGARDYAAAVVSLLLEKAVSKMLRAGATGQAENHDISSFALSLVHSLSPVDQIHVVTVLSYDLALLPAEPSADKACPDVYIMPARMQNRDLRTYRLVVLDFVHNLLTSRQFTVAFSAESMSDSINAQLTTAAETLLGVIAVLSQQHTQLTSDGKLKNAVADTAWRKTQQLGYTILDDINGMMDRHTFVDTIAGLLTNSDWKVRRKALSLANTKLGSYHSRMADTNAAEVDEMLELMQPIAQIVCMPVDEAGDSAETAMCRQAALLCVATASKKFAAKRPDLFISTFDAVVSAPSLMSDSPAVVSSALVAVTVICGELGIRLISRLPKYLPTILKHLDSVTERIGAAATTTTDELALLISGLSAIQTFVENMASFLAPSLSSLFTVLFSPAVHKISGSETLGDLPEQARAKVDDVLTALSKSVPPRQLLIAQSEFFQSSIIKQGARAIVSFVEFVGRTAGSMERTNLASYNKILFNFFLSAFDLLRNPAIPLAGAQAIEEATLAAFMRFIVKLNEGLFKPLFNSFVEWATVDVATLPDPAPWNAAASEGNDDGMEVDAIDSNEALLCQQNASELRLRVLYRTLNILFDKLKSIVAPYYVSVLPTTIEQLKRFAVEMGSVEQQEENDRAEKATPSALWCAVVESLYHSALHDAAANIWTDKNFTQVCHLLAHQISNTKVPAGTMGASRSSSSNQQQKQQQQPPVSLWAKALTRDQDWRKDELRDVVFWVIMVFSLGLGVFYGLLGLQGAVCFVSFFIGVAMVPSIYWTSYLGVDEQDFGGKMEILGDSIGTGAAVFVLSWVGVFNLLY
ncbi:snoRNA-binding rRNA-processing protein utp10 [Coemansia sp. Benny D115]|nr:snoRNA-binding rRNA-processing protein utp10 [Coemansia sp. Benny D115]